MKKTAKKLKPENVVSIFDNPRFARQEGSRPVALKRKDSGADLRFIKVEHSLFSDRGICEGDYLVCKTNFTPDEIKAETLCYVSGDIQPFHAFRDAGFDKSDIGGIIKGFQRDFRA
jgi:hypothetical protein